MYKTTARMGYQYYSPRFQLSISTEGGKFLLWNGMWHKQERFWVLAELDKQNNIIKDFVRSGLPGLALHYQEILLSRWISEQQVILTLIDYKIEVINDGSPSLEEKGTGLLDEALEKYKAIRKTLKETFPGMYASLSVKLSFDIHKQTRK